MYIYNKPTVDHITYNMTMIEIALFGKPANYDGLEKTKSIIGSVLDGFRF